MYIQLYECLPFASPHDSYRCCVLEGKLVGKISILYIKISAMIQKEKKVTLPFAHIIKSCGFRAF